ncbi:hypothetical protein [Streptomyces sp. ME18-1-4]|uniref:hypothetical protein n=1 Tax=Streptomyces sp. ME18-1-4 TaxID=3028685 RepID=UPI0029B7A0FC|nr:hypothetical protein [Streptomyces sp. ME18-1-4]MDX3241581.1 hypothetical protein [Streptomyces sp. ME18-1-4]
MPLYARRISAGPPWPRRLGSLIRGVLLVAIVLCAVVHGHGTDEEPHVNEPAAVAASEATPGAAHQHGPRTPHPQHGAEECVHEAVVRTAAEAPEQPSPGADVPTSLVAGAVALGHPLALRGTRRRRRPGNGRTQLTRTARLRI